MSNTIEPRPVIIVHLDTAPGANLTACTGTPFRPDSGEHYRDVPRVLCVACASVDSREEAAR